jgi:hypothetical protein
MHLLQRLRFCVFVAALVGEASVSIRLCDVHVLPRRVRCKRTAHCQVAGAEDGGCQKRAVRALRLRGGQETDQYAQSTSASIYRGSMPQDVSSEDEDTTLVHAMNTRSHQIQNPDATEIERLVKDTIYQAKIEEGLLPNPRYMNLSREEERQLELDELLWFAAEHGELNLAREALDAGANVSSRNRDFYNQTALHCAAQFNAGHPEMVELLVSRGADVNARNCHNNTALHEAAYWAYGSTVAKLLELGADPFVLNDLELTPLLNAEGNWAAIPRPTVALHNRDRNISLPLWEDETCGGWRHRLRTPEHRKEVVDMLKDAMGERAYGRGVDPYCGGIDFPDQWDEWNEKAEHYNPLSRPREFKTSVPPFRNPLETPLSVRPQWKPAKEMEAASFSACMCTHTHTHTLRIHAENHCSKLPSIPHATHIRVFTHEILHPISGELMLLGCVASSADSRRRNQPSLAA